MRKHKQLCSDCREDVFFASRSCDTGWELAKAFTLAVNNQVAYLQNGGQETRPKQGTLW